MPIVVFPHNLTDGTPARASEVMANFNALTAAINGALEAGNLADASVSSGKLQDLSVTTSKLDDGSVTSAKLADEAVTSGKLDDQSVTTAKLRDGSVTSDKIFAQAVTTAKLDNFAVTSGKLADGAVISQKLADGSVTNGKIFAQAVTADKLAPGVLADVGQTVLGGHVTRLMFFHVALNLDNGTVYPGAVLPTGWSAEHLSGTTFRINCPLPSGTDYELVILSGTLLSQGATSFNVTHPGPGNAVRGFMVQLA